MAGPQNNFSASKQLVTIFTPEGESVEVSRPNAIDLVRSAGYSWTAEDAGKARAETDGPEDPTSDITIIFDLEGNEVQAKKSNAREMVARGTHTWTTNSITEEDAANAVIEAVEAVKAAEELVIPSEDETLTEEVKRVTGGDDVAQYLEGFSMDALKTIASERYGESLHHRASKETAIAKIVEFEEARQLAD